MQTFRTTVRRLPQVQAYRINKQIPALYHTTSKMSLFPRSFQEFSPVFRLLDDYDRATRHIAGGSSPFSQSLRSFTPKFDVKELKDSYELHGELPGIEQKDVDIEWTDGNTLTISGRTEHRSQRGTPPKGYIEGEASSKDESNKENQPEYHKPTVEDETEGSAATGKAVTTTNAGAGTDVAQKPAADGPKYWVTERSVGEFHRSFSFPTRVDQEGVKASLNNGILSIVVPKAAAPKPRKITIQ